MVQGFVFSISSLDAQHAEILSRLEASAGTRRGKLTFVSMDVTSEDNKGVLDYFGVKAEDAPTIYLVVLKEQMLKYIQMTRLCSLVSVGWNSHVLQVRIHGRQRRHHTG